MNIIILMLLLTIRILIPQTYFTIECWSFWWSFNFDKNQPSNSIDNISVNLYLWRKAWLHLGDCPIISCGLFSIAFYFIRIWCSKHLNSRNILRFDVKLNIACRWKEAKIESFEHVLLNVLLIDCAEIVESFDIFEHFASWRLEICWNSDYWSVNIV